MMNAAETLQIISTARGDLELYGLVKQVCEITGSSNDVAITTLFDCNYDVERAVDKIFERINEGGIEEEKQSNTWKEVAKVKRKGATGDIVIVEDLNNDCKVEENPRDKRVSGRGRTRGGRGSSLHAIGRGQRYQGSKTKRREYENYEYEEVNDTKKVDNPSNEWILDAEVEPTTCIKIDNVTELSTISLDEDNAAKIVSKLSSKEGVFGDFSRTKAPPRSSIVATVPVKLVTSTGVISLPSSVFNFGLDFSEYCLPTNVTKTSGKICNDENSIIIQQEIEEKINEENFRNVVIGNNEITKVYKNHNDISKSKGDLDNVESKKINIPHADNYDRFPSVNSSFSSSLPTNHTTYSSDTTFPPSMLSPSPQLCPPPGMSNAHILQQIHNNPQQYLSLMNLPSGPSLFDMVSSANDNPQFLHSLLDNNNKEYSAKNSKPHEQDHQNVINTMQMPNICCFPQMYMNNFTNFLPTMPGNHSNVSLASSSHQEVSSNNHPSVTDNSTSIRNHRNESYSIDSSKFEDLVLPSKPKYVRTPNYGNNYVSAESGVFKEDGHDKSSRHSTTPANRTVQSQQGVPNDPRFLAFPYQNNMFNCVTAPGSHPSGPHPYSMAHQLMQQQLHNFPSSYQFPEHLMTSMAPNGNTRNNAGSSNNRSNTLWHPANK